MSEDRQFRVSWHIDVWAQDVQEAAEKALEIQRDPESTAVVFNVTDQVRAETEIGDLRAKLQAIP